MFGEEVLIESDWNLKTYCLEILFQALNVLIESDWNLKEGLEYGELVVGKGINRIRLEFKEGFSSCLPVWQNRINRIRLEFKAACHDGINAHEFSY